MSKLSRLILGILLIATNSVLAYQGGSDSYGYMWTSSRGGAVSDTIGYNWIDAKDGNVLISGNFNNEIASFQLPFQFDFYGHMKDSLYVSANGLVTFSNPGSSLLNTNQSIPTTGIPDSMIAVYWDNLTNGTLGGGVYWKVIGASPNRKLIVEWDIRPGAGGFPDAINFQVVLFETSNLIKLQYHTISASYNGGGSTTIGIEMDGTDGIEYSYVPTQVPTDTVGAGTAILFHNRTLGTASASIAPASGSTGAYENFTYRFYDIDLAGADDLGKADRFSIANPFTDDSNRPTVTNIKINTTDAFIKYTTDKPVNPGYATWHYNATTDSILIQTSYFDVIDSLVVSFGQTMPGSPSSGNTFASTYNAKLDQTPTASATDGGLSIDVSGTTSTVTNYTFEPSGQQLLRAGGNIEYTITARDQAGLATVNNDSIDLSTPGSSTAWFNGNITGIRFSNASTVVVTINDTSSGTFNLKAENTDNSNITGQSDQIVVSAAIADHFEIPTASIQPLTVGSDRQLQVTLLDVYNNVLTDSSVIYNQLAGTGGFEGASSANTTTNSSGVASALYTARTNFSFDNDTIEVVAGTIRDTLIIPLKVGPLSSYSFSPATNQNIVAGGSILFNLTAHDAYNNEVQNSQTVTLSTPGSSTAWFTGLPLKEITFANQTNVSFTVNDTTVGVFNVRAVNQTNASVTGQSGEITVSADAANYFFITSLSEQPVGVGVTRLIQTYLYDQFSNPVTSGNVAYTRFQGDGLFDNASNTITSPVDANGLSEATYTASTDIGIGTDRIEISAGAAIDTIDLALVAGNLSELRLQVGPQADVRQLGDTTVTADESFSVIALGYDTYGNYLGRVASNWTSTGVVTGNISPANPTDSVFFDPISAGIGTFKATANGSSVSGSSGQILVNPGAVSSILVRTAPDGEGQTVGAVGLNVGQSLYLYSNGYDADGNWTANQAVDWITTGGIQIGDLSATTNVSATILQPTITGSGTVQSSSIFNDGSTGTLTVTTGDTAYIRIETAAGGNQPELIDRTESAGTNLQLFAAAYDISNTYIGPATVNWTLDPSNSVGSFATATPANQNTFTFEIIGSTKIRIETISSSFNDYSGIISITAGNPVSITKNYIGITPSITPGGIIPDSLWIKVRDAYSNPVSGAGVTWSTTTGGILNPEIGSTNALGEARSKWQVKNTLGLDSALATVAGIVAPVVFYANVTNDTANQITEVDGNGQIDIVMDTLDTELTVQVLDQFSNPVQGVNVTFSINSAQGDVPEGATGYLILNPSSVTNESGLASTRFRLGTLVGDYTVRAYNSQLVGSPITFTLTATADDATEILVYSGDEQTGPVGNELADSIKIRIVDQYGNIKAGETVDWAPEVGSGSASPIQNTTNVQGFAATAWTLGTVAGLNTMDVGSGALPAVQFTATGNSNPANSIVVFSGDAQTVVTGGTQRIEARVLDQFGNPVSNQEVVFLPAGRVSNQTSQTNANGVAQSVYTAPQNQDSSIARAYVTGLADTARFKIYALRYLSNSLSPVASEPGQTEAFYITVSNPGDSILTPGTTTLSFDDGTAFYSAALDSPVSINPRQNVRLKFAETQIPSNISGGNYTPEINFEGDGDLTGFISTEVGVLAINPLSIAQIEVQNPPDKMVARGGTVNQILMQVDNNGNYVVDVDDASLTFDPALGIVASAIPGNPAQIAANSSADFYFSASVPGTAVAGLVTVDGSIDGNTNGATVYDRDADITDQFTIVDSTQLQYVAGSITPDTVSQNQSVTFNVDVNSTGSFDILLNSANTRINFNGTEFFLAQNQTLAANEATKLIFSTGSIGAILPGLYNGTIYLSGTENGYAYNDTLQTIDAGDNLLVQTPAAFNIDSLVASTSVVSQGMDTLISVYVTNSGQADAVLEQFVISPYGLPVEITPELPVRLAGVAQQEFVVKTSIPIDALTGVISLDATASGYDWNSNTEIEDIDADTPGSWTVFEAPVLLVDEIASDVIAVSPGDQNVPVRITLNNSNAGGSPITINSVSLSPQIGTYQETAASYPVILNPGQSQLFNHSLDVGQNTATGQDTLYAVVNYTNNYSGETQIATGTAFLTWKINLSQGAVNIVSVRAGQEKVSLLQDSAMVEVRLKNNTQSTVEVDSLDLVFANGSENYTTEVSSVTPLGTLSAGEDRTFNMLVTVLGTAPLGTDQLHAVVRYLEQGIYESTNEDPLVSDTWNVLERPDIIIDSVRVNPSIASTGQTGLTGSVYLSNVSGPNRADAIVDSVNLKLFDGGFDETDQFAISIKSTPSLGAVLKPGQSIRYDFNLSVPEATIPSTYQTRATVKGRDVNDDRDTTVTEVIDPGNFTVQTPAQITINSIEVKPDTVSQGQRNVRIVGYFQNTGQANAIVNSTSIIIEPGLTDDFTPILKDKSLPFMISGGQLDSIVYEIHVDTDSYTGTPDVTISLEGIDQNSEMSINASVEESDAFFVQVPADIFWITGSTRPQYASSDTMIQFELDLDNLGEADADLDRINTKLMLEGTAIEIGLDVSSPTLIPGNPLGSLPAAELLFTPTEISQAILNFGTYPLTLNMEYNSNEESFTESITVGEFTFGNNLVVVGSINLPGKGTRIYQGDTLVTANMPVLNTTNLTLPIDNDTTKTTLLFREYPDGPSTKELYISNLRRTDGITELLPDTTTYLTFEFDVSNIYPIGQSSIWGVISADNGNAVDSSAALIVNVFSIGNPEYVVNSLDPDTVVQGQNARLALDFINNGTGDINLIPDSSYIEIDQGGPIFLAGRYSLKGKDSTTIIFNESQINESLGSYPISWHLRGELPNGDDQSWDGDANDLQVVDYTRLQFADIIFNEDTVRTGQKNIQVRYDIQNTGQTTALIRGFTFRFNNIDLEPGNNVDISPQWSLVNQQLEATTIKPGQTEQFIFKYNLAQTDTLGRVVPAPIVTYADSVLPDINRTSAQIITNDTVMVIQAADLHIAEVVAQIPKTPTVNTGQPFNLSVSLTNNGGDYIANAVVEIKRNQAFRELLTFENIPPAQTISDNFTESLPSVGNYEFKARIISATDPTGANVNIGQPVDNSEIVITQTPAELFISSQIIDPPGARDSVLSVGQTFTLKSAVLNNGQSSFGPGSLTIDNYSGKYQPGDGFQQSQPISQGDNEVEWELTPLAAISGPDSLIVRFNPVPTDSNTSQVAIAVPADTINVRIVDSANIGAGVLTVIEPDGAIDQELSTSQEFVLKSKYTFNSAISPENRVARIILPQGYSVKGSSVDTLGAGDSDSTYWSVLAPATVHSEQRPIRVQVSGRDRNDNRLIQAASPVLQFTAIEKSTLTLAIRIEKEGGTADNKLSPGQSFRVIANVVPKPGTAGVEGEGEILISPSAGLEFDEGESLPRKPYTVNTDIEWRLKVKESALNTPVPADAANQNKQDLPIQIHEGGPADQLLPADVLGILEQGAIGINESITVQVENTPIDINSDSNAVIANPTEVQQVEVFNPAEITNIEFPDVPNTVSTGQTFSYTIRATIQEDSRLISPIATVLYPGNFNLPGDTSRVPLEIIADGTMAFGTEKITVPSTYNGIAFPKVFVSVSGIDANSGQAVVSSPDSLTLNIQEKAKLAIQKVALSPISIDSSGFASLGQRIIVTMNPQYAPKNTNLEYANIIESGSIRIDNDALDLGFELESDTVQFFTNLTQELTWTLTAPAAELTTNLRFKFDQYPKDENDGQSVLIDPVAGTLNIPLRVRKKTVTVKMLDVDSTLTETSGEKKLLAFEIQNEDYGEPLYVDGVEFSLWQGTELLNGRSIAQMIQRLRVVDSEDDVTEGLTKPNQVYVDTTVSDNPENPVVLEFSNTFEIEAGTTGILYLLAEYKPGLRNRSFVTYLDDLWAWDSQPDILLDIVDESGTKVNESDMLKSSVVQIKTQSQEDAFGNYPNPFGRTHKLTTIAFTLDNDSEVEIRIFTLLGELVKTWELENRTAGDHRDIRWDGTNDLGNKVLNGVYLCTIDIKPQSGGSNQRYITKIAYIK